MVVIQAVTTINSGSITSYEIMGLQEYTNYVITVRASNSAPSSAVSNIFAAMTMKAGE